MSKDITDTTRLIENQWVDIVPPAAPDSQLWLWWSLAVALLMIIVFCVVWIWQRQPRQRLKRNMRRLLTSSSTVVDPKNKLRQLEKALCQHYQAAQLSNIKIDNDRWDAFKQQLQKACYQAQTVDEQYATELIQQAQSILLASSS